MRKEIEISVVSPVYRAENMIEELVERLESTLDGLNMGYEIILVDDRSPDGSWEKLRSVAAIKPRVKAFRLSRNFGQHNTITAGLIQSVGKWVVVMDCDLQDRPEEIPRLFLKSQGGL